MSITALPTPPLRGDGPANFADRGDTFIAALPVFVTEANALEVNVNAKELAASNSAAAALASQIAALASEQATTASRNATMWLAATYYAAGVLAYSPVNGRVYRRKVAGTTATDPSADTTNWAIVDGSLSLFIVSAATQAAVAGNHYVLTNVAATTVTLPAVVAEGDTVWVTVANALDTNIIARNGKTIMGVAEDMEINLGSAADTVKLRYINTDWKLV